MASQATLGLKDLCRECQLQMRSYAEPLLNACQQSLLGGRLKNSECVRLMFSIGKIMSMLPPDKIPICLDSMVSPCFQELQTLTQAAQVCVCKRTDEIFSKLYICVLCIAYRIGKNSHNIPIEYDFDTVFVAEYKHRRRWRRCCTIIRPRQRYTTGVVCHAKDNADFQGHGNALD